MRGPPWGCLMKLIERVLLPGLVAVALVCPLRADNSPASRPAFRHSYALSPHGRVDIENLYGDVCITGWDRDEVRIEAFKNAVDAAPLEDAMIVVDATADRLSVRTRYAGTEPLEPASVEYRIMMPRTADLENAHLVNGALSLSGLAGSVTATSVNGSIKAEALEGSADLATVNGHVAAGFDRVSAAPISLRSVNGPIVLTIPRDSRIQLVARNRSGEIESDLPPPAVQPARHHLETVLGGGGAPILLRNVNGGISVHSVWSRRHERLGL